MKNDMANVTLYDLMAEDFSVWIKQNPKFGFDLCIEGDDPTERIEINGVHSAAMESFSDFCRRFVYFYDRIHEKEEMEAA
jgi:hypothetical protein